MKRVVADRYGGPEVLVVVEDQAARPAHGEVCVRVLAAGVSYTDMLIRAGAYLGGPKPPLTPGTSSWAWSRRSGPDARACRSGIGLPR